MERRTLPWIRLAVLAAVAVAVLLVLASIGEVVEVVLVAALLAYLLDPLARRLERRGMRRRNATAVVFTGLVLVIVGLLLYLLPVLAHQVQALQDGANLVEAMAMIERIERLLENNLGFLGVRDLALLESMQAIVREWMTHIVDFVPSVLAVLTNVLVVPFIMFFLLKDGRRIRRAVVRTVPNRYFEFTLNVLYKMDQQLGNYLRGQVVDALLVGLLSVLALWIIGLDYFIVIGLFAGLCNLIPYLGPLAGSIVAVGVSVFTGGTPAEALAIVLAFGGIQLIDNALLHPLVVARNVKLHPLTIVLAVLIGGKFFGFMGLLLAVPGAAVAKVVFIEVSDNLRSYRLA